LTELPASFRRLQAIMLNLAGGDREIADILALILHHHEALVEQDAKKTQAALRSRVFHQGACRLY
jgi:hypothetical protein